MFLMVITRDHAPRESGSELLFWLLFFYFNFFTLLLLHFSFSFEIIKRNINLFNQMEIIMLLEISFEVF